MGERGGVGEGKVIPTRRSSLVHTPGAASRQWLFQTRTGFQLVKERRKKLFSAGNWKTYETVVWVFDRYVVAI